MSPSEEFVCQRCGICCKTITINVAHSDIIRWLQEKRWDILDEISYIEQLKGFYIRDTAEKKGEEREPCPFLGKADDELPGCSIYETRPRACADFPHGHKPWYGCYGWAKAKFARDPVKDEETYKTQTVDFNKAEAKKHLLLHFLYLAQDRNEEAIERLLDPLDPDETLWCNSFDNTTREWTETGANPYLNDSTLNYISSSTKKAVHANFGFANTAHGGDTLNSVYLYLEGSGNGVDSQDVFLNDGAGWTPSPYGFVFGAMGWVNVDVSGFLDTWAKVDACLMRIDHENAANACTIRRAYLFCNYTGLVSASENLFAEFNVQVPLSSGSENLFAKFNVRQETSEGLFAKFTIRSTATRDLFSKFVLALSDSKTLFTKFIVRQSGTEDLFTEFVVRQTTTKDLFAKFGVYSSSYEELFTEFLVRQAATKDLFAKFELPGADAEDLFAKFDVRQETSENLFSKFTIRSTATRVLFSKFALALSDSEEIFAKFNVRQETSQELFAKFICGFLADSEDLFSKFTIRRETSLDFFAKFSIRRSATLDYFCKFDVRQTGIEDLFAKFILPGAGSEDLFAEFIIGAEAFLDFFAKFSIRRSAAQNLPASFNVRGSALQELFAEFIVTSSDYEELFAEFQLPLSGAQSLFAKFQLPLAVAVAEVRGGEIYETGIHRIVYRAGNFDPTKTVTAYVWSPDLIKSGLQSLTAVGEGFYYLDYDFPNEGLYFLKFYENGVAKESADFRIIDLGRLVRHTIVSSTDPLDSIGRILKALHGEAGGRWRIIRNRLRYYKEDGKTLLNLFKLLDSLGNEAEQNVYERIPIDFEDEKNLFAKLNVNP